VLLTKAFGVPDVAQREGRLFWQVATDSLHGQQEVSCERLPMPESHPDYTLYTLHKHCCLLYGSCRQIILRLQLLEKLEGLPQQARRSFLHVAPTLKVGLGTDILTRPLTSPGSWVSADQHARGSSNTTH
jgi:hypothetical protein